MSAYIARRIFLMIPTLLGILFVSFVVVQFAPGGPVERVIAQLSGADTGASRVSGASGGDFGNRAQAGAGTLCADAVEFRPLRFRQKLFPRHQRAAADQGEAAGLDVAGHLDDAP